MSDSTVWGLILPVLSGPVKKAFYNSYSQEFYNEIREGPTYLGRWAMTEIVEW